jgi:hypothetical protein
MSIRPPSDIILDVAQAARPAKAHAAIEKLIGGTGQTDENTATDFSTALTSVKDVGGNPMPLAFAHIPSSRQSAAPDARTKAYEGLEQLVLKGLLETMLPKDAGTIFGRGAAGDIWRSMLADELAAGLGRTIDLGIAKRTLGKPALPTQALTSARRFSRA